MPSITKGKGRFDLTPSPLKLLLALLFIFPMLNGCYWYYFWGYGDLRAQNSSNLMKLDLGMSKSQVVQVMGEDGFGSISNPMNREMIPWKNGEMYDVLYYYTQYIDYESGKDWDSGVTPVILKNNKVIGWGWKHLQDEDLKTTLTIKHR